MSGADGGPKGRAATDGTPVPSPCTNVCRMDEVSGLCRGCWRTLEEIAAWSVLDDDGRRAVWRDLQARRQAAGGGAA